MSERPGSLEARRMYKSSLSLEEWEGCVAKYGQAVSCVAAGKSKLELVDWDQHLWCGLVSAVESRDPKHITHSELADIMKWKLARGKARPLQKLVESNSPPVVVKASTEAFKFLEKGQWEKAIDSVTTLKAVGVATATAILAPFAPSLVPFMADEVMEAVSTKRDYTMKIYKEMRTALITKATELQEIANAEENAVIKEWTAELIGKALWVKAMMAVYPEIAIENESTAATKATETTSASTSSKKVDKRKSDVAIESVGEESQGTEGSEPKKGRATKKGRA